MAGAGPCIPPSSCKLYRDLPDGPVVKTLLSSARGTGSIPGQGIKIPHAESGGKKKKKRLYRSHEKVFYLVTFFFNHGNTHTMKLAHLTILNCTVQWPVCIHTVVLAG